MTLGPGDAAYDTAGVCVHSGRPVGVVGRHGSGLGRGAGPRRRAERRGGARRSMRGPLPGAACDVPGGAGPGGSRGSEDHQSHGEPRSEPEMTRSDITAGPGVTVRVLWVSSVRVRPEVDWK